MVGMSVELHTKSMASDMLRCGKLPIPNVAPGRRVSAVGIVTAVPFLWSEIASTHWYQQQTPPNELGNSAFVLNSGQAREMTWPSALSPQRVIVGFAIVAWLGLALTAPWHAAGDGHSFAVAVVLATWGWALWVAVAIAVLVPSPLSVTAVRTIAPLAVVCSFAAVSPVSIFSAIVMMIVSMSSLFTDIMVQGGAYGDEKRFALRTPMPYFAPAFVAWAALTSTLVGGSLLIAARAFWIGVPLVVLGVVMARFVPRRLHRLSRRWLVIVPAGIVVHDHLVLAETMMTPKANVISTKVVDAVADSADLTGGVLGSRLSIEMKEADKVVLSAITAKTLKTSEALHVKTFSIAPRRVHAALAAITR